MNTYSLNKIKRDFPDPLLFNCGFLETDYSKFKFGCKNVAKQFGYSLADGFTRDSIKSIISTNPDKKIVVISSPYCFIPTATFAMKDYFVQRLNAWLVQNDYGVVEETKIHRIITYKEDYGGLSAEERLSLIKNDGFHIDKEFCKGKMLLFLDDIKITGSHQKVIERMIEQYDLGDSHMFLYFAELADDTIHPSIENHLNYYFVKSLLDLDKIIKNENFLLNTRTVKYILNSPFNEFKTFIDYQPLRLVNNIYHQAIGNSYHLIDDYKVNLNYIKKLIQ